ncbi:MAG: RodZ domain-containing protein [Pseudomonadota bacterium]
MNNNNRSLNNQSPGELLKKQRQTLGKSEREAADALKISVHRLKAIEADDFSDFPSETYVRGHLKNYGRVLGLDEATIIQAYNAIAPQQATQEEIVGNPDTDVSATNSHKQWWLVYVVLVVFVLLWVLSYWILGTPNDDTAFPESLVNDEAVVDNFQVLVEPQKQQPLAQEKRSAAGAGAEQLSVVASKIVASKITAAELVGAIQAEQEQQLAQATVSEPESESDSLTFGFDNDCWLKVTDANGDVIYSGLQRSGSQLTLRGRAPFRLIIGNVEGTSLVYNGTPVQLSAENGRRSVRLQVGS